MLCAGAVRVMVMTTVCRGSVGGGVAVGRRARERGTRSHDHAGRVSAPQEIVAQTRRRALAGRAEQGGQAAAAGLEAALGLGDLDEGGLDGQTRHGARDALLAQLLAEAATADLPAAGARFRPEACEGLVVDVAAGLQLVHHGTGDLRRRAPTPEPPAQLARAPGLHGQKLEGRQLGGLRVQLPRLSRRARASAARRHQPFLKTPGRVTEGAPTNPALEESQVISPVEKMPLTLRSKSSGLVAASRAVSYVTSSSR